MRRNRAISVIAIAISEKLEKAGTVDFENHPAQKLGTRSQRCRPKVPGRFAFPGARTPGICSISLRSSQTGTLQTGTLRIRGKSLECRQQWRERREKGGPLWQKHATCEFSESARLSCALKLKVPVYKVPVCEPTIR